MQALLLLSASKLYLHVNVTSQMTSQMASQMTWSLFSQQRFRELRQMASDTSISPIPGQLFQDRYVCLQQGDQWRWREGQVQVLHIPGAGCDAHRPGSPLHQCFDSQGDKGL